MALVDAENPGGGTLVIAGARPVGDTNSSAVYVSDLPRNFHGGDESLHFALGELFGQYGKIKKIELYMEKGILETENFKGEALVVYHRSKGTGSRDKNDPVYQACSEMDGKVRVLGKRNWRIKCEAATWQKEGYDVKEKPKLAPCVEISNLWDYDPKLPMSWFIQMQEVIRSHAAEHIQSPFVKTEPSTGMATIWCKGAQDAMKFAQMMHKSYFMGRKIVAALCRKEKPVSENALKLPTGDLTMHVPAGMEAKWTPGADPSNNLEAIPLIPRPEQIGPALPPGAEPPVVQPASIPEAPKEQQQAPTGLRFVLGEDSKVVLKGLVSKPEYNGREATVAEFLQDVQKYQVRFSNGRLVKVKPENLEVVPTPLAPEDAGFADVEMKEAEAEAPDAEDAENAETAEAALALAKEMAAGKVRHGPEPDLSVDGGFVATVCVDPALLPKRETAEDAAPIRRRVSSRSRERRQEERIAAVKARLEAEKGSRPKWVVEAPAAAAQATMAQNVDGVKREPEESREELLKMSVSKLKEMLTKFGKTARGCVEKRDFVDRLKPAPKS